MYSVLSLNVIVAVALVSGMAQAAPASRLMKVGVREMLTVDAKKMEKFVETEMKKVEKEDDDDVYMDMAANVLSQYVLVHPNLTERQAGISHLRGKLSDGLYPLVLEKAAQKLLMVVKESQSPADQASAFWAITTLVKESKSLRKEEKEIVKPVIEEIAGFDFKLSKDAQKYSRDSMMPIFAPNKEAKDALKYL